MVTHAYNSRAQAVESGGSEIEGHPQLHIKFDWATEDPAKERKGERKEGRKRRRKGNREEGSDLEKEGPELSRQPAGVTLSPRGMPPVIWEPPPQTHSPL